MCSLSYGKLRLILRDSINVMPFLNTVESKLCIRKNFVDCVCCTSVCELSEAKLLKYDFCVTSCTAASCGGPCELSAAQLLLINQCIKKVKDTCARLSSDHKDLHGMVSKVGKAIDKVFALRSTNLLCYSVQSWELGGVKEQFYHHRFLYSLTTVSPVC
jgi:hypothetical protein